MATKTKGLSKKSFSLRTFKDDAIAGFVNAVVSVPDGLATAALAGVNPVAGLYASATGPLAGGFLQSSHLMRSPPRRPPASPRARPWLPTRRTSAQRRCSPSSSSPVCSC